MYCDIEFVGFCPDLEPREMLHRNSVISPGLTYRVEEPGWTSFCYQPRRKNAPWPRTLRGLVRRV
jgi:hypothetical protein